MAFGSPELRRSMLLVSVVAVCGALWIHALHPGLSRPASQDHVDDIFDVVDDSGAQAASRDAAAPAVVGPRLPEQVSPPPSPTLVPPLLPSLLPLPPPKPPSPPPVPGPDPACKGLLAALGQVQSTPVSWLNVTWARPLDQDPCPTASTGNLRLVPEVCGLGRLWAFRQLQQTDATCRAALRAGKIPELGTLLDGLRSSREPHVAELAEHLSCAAGLPGSLAVALKALEGEAVPDDACVDLVFRSEEPAARKAQAEYLAGFIGGTARADTDADDLLSWPYLPMQHLRPAQRESLGPLLRYMNAAHLPRRDALYAALCTTPPPTSEVLRTACAEQGPAREPLWGILDGHSTNLGRVRDEYLDELAPTLQNFLSTYDQSYVRLFDALCVNRLPRTAAMRAACAAVPSNQLRDWHATEAGQHAQEALSREHAARRLALVVVTTSMPLLGLFLLALFGLRDDDHRLVLVILGAAAGWLGWLSLPGGPGVTELFAVFLCVSVLSLLRPLRMVFGVAMAGSYVLMVIAALLGMN